MELIGIVILCFLTKIMINIVLTIIGVIKDLDCLYFYHKIEEIYYDNNCMIAIMTVIMILFLYPYIFMMACIQLLYILCHMCRRKH